MILELIRPSKASFNWYFVVFKHLYPPKWMAGSRRGIYEANYSGRGGKTVFPSHI